MIKLDFFDRSDFKQLIEWSGDEAFLLQWSGNFKYPLTEEQLDKYLDGANDLSESDKLIFKAIDVRTEAVVGHIAIGGMDREHRSGRIGKVLVAPAGRGKGIGQQMIKAVLQIGFETLHLHRISLGAFDFNKAAIQCYENCGFHREGLLRDVRRYKDTYWNLIEMSILEDEWRKI